MLGKTCYRNDQALKDDLKARVLIETVISDEIEQNEVYWNSQKALDIDGYVQGLDVTNAVSALAIAQQDIIELKSKVNALELTSFLILE